MVVYPFALILSLCLTMLFFVATIDHLNNPQALGYLVGGTRSLLAFVLAALAWTGSYKIMCYLDNLPDRSL